jgi:hypothetical protein
MIKYSIEFIYKYKYINNDDDIIKVGNILSNNIKKSS